MCHLTPAINYISGHTKLLEEKKRQTKKHAKHHIQYVYLSPLGSAILCVLFFFVSWFFGVGGVGWSLREETLQR
jgi:hypothetical protein